MEINYNSRSNLIWDFFFGLAIIMTTMTNLRIGDLPLGPGELLLIIWVIKIWLSNIRMGNIIIDHINKPVIIFWYFLFLSLFFGSIYSIIFEQASTSSIIYNSLAYIFSFIISITLLFPSQRKTIDRKVKIIITIGPIIFLLLSFWWIFISFDFFGILIQYGSFRFTGGAKNPNQLALFIVVIPFLILYFIRQIIKDKQIYHIILYIFIFISSLYVGSLINSDGLNGTWIISFSLLIFLLIYIKQNYPFNIFIPIIILSIILLILLFNPWIIKNIIERSINWFNEVDQGGSRARLWRLGIYKGLESPVFGFGPGAHVERLFSSNTAEAHNIYIDLFTQGGLIAFFTLFYFLIKVFFNIYNNPYLITVFISLLTFSFTHFTMRQPFFWVIIIFLYYKSRSNMVTGVKI